MDELLNLLRKNREKSPPERTGSYFCRKNANFQVLCNTLINKHLYNIIFP